MRNENTARAAKEEKSAMKTTIKRLAAGALAALCMLPFSGCGVLFSDDTEALMRPPRLMKYN